MNFYVNLLNHLTDSDKLQYMTLPTQVSNCIISLLLTEFRGHHVRIQLFGPRRDEVTGEWRRLHNKELNDQYSPPNIVRVIKSRRMRWAGHVVHMGEERGVYRVFVGKPEGKRPLGRPRRRWVDNEPSGSVKCGEFLD